MACNLPMVIMPNKPVRTIADIAQLAGVSKAIVSRAMNDSPLVSHETKTRIQTIAREHNYRVHQIARSLSLRRSQTVAFVMPVEESGSLVNNPFRREVLGAIATALSAYRYDMLIVQTKAGDLEWPHRYLDSGRADGFILLTCARCCDYIRLLIERQAPFVVWGTPLPDHRYSTVSGDNVMGGRLATEHLIASGRRRIGFLGGIPGQQETQKRHQGYADALQAAGRAIDPALVTYGDYTSASGAEGMLHLLNQAPDLDGVLVNSDLMAIAAMSILQKKGYRIPEDVAVVGYDDIFLAAHCTPPLTTVRQDIERIGGLLVETLMQNLETGAIANVTMPAELVVRQSSGFAI